MSRTEYPSVPSAKPLAAPRTAQHTPLAAFIRTLSEAEAARPPRPKACIWDGAQNRYRDVDPADETDYLCSLAAEMLELAGHAVQLAARRTFWARLREWLPSFTASRGKARANLAAGYLQMARVAAARGDHVSAQGSARCCVELLRAKS